MVMNRDSIIAKGRLLAELVLEGGSILPQHMAMARRLLEACSKGGTYHRQYDDPEQRVMMRHLNLYKNKMAAAKTESEKTRWKAKVLAQEDKIADWKGELIGGVDGLDLDGL